MRIHVLIFFGLMATASCTTDSRDKDAGFIVFVTKPVQSPSLLVTPTLKCYPGKQHLALSLNLKNLVSGKITIKEVTLNTSDGLKSLPENGTEQPFTLMVGRDTTTLLIFNPINDKALFQATGLQGLIDSTYAVSVFYTIEGEEGIRVVNLSSSMPMEIFLAYRKYYDKPVAVYHFNTGNGFDEKQKVFLQTNLKTPSIPFVHLTEQEMAVSGLNFRIKCFHQSDTLYAELFAVNHSDMTIKIDTMHLALFMNNTHDISKTIVRCEKVTGSRNENDILRKGDRVIITMKKYVHDHPENLSIVMAESFFLSSGKPLFNDNVELIRLPESF